MGLKQMLDMIWNDLDESFRDEVPERVAELEASSVLNREARLSIMLCCVVDSVRSKLSFADSELAAASTVTHAAQEDDRGCWSNFAATWVA